MPELPEVETTRRGLAPQLIGRRVIGVDVRERRLRWPVPRGLGTRLCGQTLRAIERRAKYLLVHTDAGSALLHLGMSGSLRVIDPAIAPGPHDHYDWRLDSGRVLRYTDSRRFGCLLWQAPGRVHPLLAGLGPEPLSDAFGGDVLWRAARGRRAPIKQVLMDPHVVVGIGNIYAAEALFAAGIRPGRAAGSVSRRRCLRLAGEARRILAHAIARGGTTLRDFIAPDGMPGYFEQELFVYGREGLPCKVCGALIRSKRIGQRSSFYCPRCQA
jgi:formamidopyrimidine-DNA glycosylase